MLLQFKFDNNKKVTLNLDKFAILVYNIFLMANIS